MVMSGGMDNEEEFFKEKWLFVLLMLAQTAIKSMNAKNH